jgi:DNA-binding IclR family transcriptional regulator
MHKYSVHIREQDEAPAASSEVKSAARVLDVLELLAQLGAGIRLNELARQLGIPRSSASGLMATLSGRGYVESHGDGYRLAASFRNAGWVGGTSGALLRAAQPVMRKLARQTEESAFLGIPTADLQVRYVAKEIGDSPIAYDVELNTQRAAYSTTIGTILLSGMDPPALDHYLQTHELRRMTPHTETDAQRIRQAVAQARERGHVILVDSNVMGASGAAAPIRAGGKVIAGLSVIAPSSRFDPRRDHIIECVMAAAAEIGAALEDGSSAPSVRTGRHIEGTAHNE